MAINWTLTQYCDAILRIFLACVLGGIVGYERAQINRPAGFRTHILVCAGSALVMLTGEYIYNVFGGIHDPARLGAQVVSGIGFLGAGTILRSGFKVQGLTTAAGLWAVSCVGLACGIGFYFGALVTSLIICITMVSLKRLERKLWLQHTKWAIRIRTSDLASAMNGINTIFSEFGIEIRHVDFVGDGGDEGPSVKFTVKMPNCSVPQLYEKIQCLSSILEVQIENQTSHDS